MENFEFVSPTHFVFGRGAEEQVGEKLAAAGAKRVLVHFGGGSAVASGLIDRVGASLDAAGIEHLELGGVRPNPEITLVREGVKLCKEAGVDWILAVGGGSVIDSAKAIANGACVEGDVWELFETKATDHDVLPIAVVLTIPAAGSEASKNTVISNDELGRKTVMDLVSDIPARLYPVGRLDKDSEGLLLMTNDGAFAQAVTHPSGGISKLYRVTVQPRADEATILKLSSGVVLDDGTKTMPCAINVVTDEPGRTVMEMTLKEGKNREIRRMCEAVGLEVVRLKRNAEGVVKLGMLKPGTYRELTKAEVNGLRAAAAKGRAQTRSAAVQSKAAERRPRGPVGKGTAPKKRK